MEEKVIRKRKITFIIFFIIVFGYSNIVAYAQAEMDSNQEQQVVEINNNNEEDNETKILELFTVDNNTYKVLKLDKHQNIVMFWKCDNLDNLEKVIVNNEVEYEGHKFKVEYICKDAFKGNKTLKNIVINDDVFGFCDSEGNLIQTIDSIFQNQGKLESINLGNTKFILGVSCFQNCCSLKNIDLSKIKKIKGQSCFAGCRKLENIGEFNDEVTELPARAFFYCNILKVNSLNNITKLGNKCFENCMELDQDIVTGVEEIGDNCFWGSSFSEVYLEKAKKIGYNAFGGSPNLKKIKFGNPNIPIFTKNIAQGSCITEWVYPLKYTTQSNYLEFLKNLRISKVIWDYNYENLKCEKTQDVKLNSLNHPHIIRYGYELEGWYKEPECLNKVNKIADLGEINGSDIIIKDPKLYAKWIAKDVNDHEEEDNSGESEDNNDHEEEDNPGGSEDNNDHEEEDNPGGSEDNNDHEEEDNPGESEYNNDQEEEDNAGESEYNNNHEEEDNPGEPEDDNDQEEEDNSNESEVIHNLEDMINISHKSKKNNNEIKINDFKYVSQDGTNNNVQIVTNGYITKIMKNNKCIAIYLNSNDKLYYLNTMNYGYKGSIKIKGNNINNKWYYLKDDESLMVDTSSNGYDVIYYEKLI